MPHRFLKRCSWEQRPVSILYIVHFAFGKRVWTRNAPTARARAAICVQRFDDSLNPAIHITYRVSRRSSSLREPRDPSLKGKSFGLFECVDSSVGCWVWVKTKKKSAGSSSRCHAKSRTYAVCLFLGFVNVIDPSAGSPTETLLRLLLPRNVQI